MGVESEGAAEKSPYAGQRSTSIADCLAAGTSNFPYYDSPLQIELAAGLSALFRLSEDRQRVLVVEVDDCVDEVVCRSYQSEARGSSASSSLARAQSLAKDKQKVANNHGHGKS